MNDLKETGSIELKEKQEIVPALICIPDLTGFTRFVSEAGIDFSRKVIPPLLQTIINANVLGFRMSEIEGDAILFFRTGPLPSLGDLIEQCKAFYTDFERQLNQIKLRHEDDYQKHISPGRLGLKIILHYGDISLSPISDRIKLIGEDVIIAHRLLKNSVKDHEYLLFTEKFLANYTDMDISRFFNQEKVSEGEDRYDHIGKIKYRYINPESLFTSARGSR